MIANQLHPPTPSGWELGSGAQGLSGNLLTREWKWEEPRTREKAKEQRAHCTLIEVGREVIRPCGLVALWPYGLVALWPCGLMALWPYGLVALWPYGLMALWPYGLVALWPYGLMALWPCGSLSFSSWPLRPYGLHPLKNKK